MTRRVVAMTARLLPIRVAVIGGKKTATTHWDTLDCRTRALFRSPAGTKALCAILSLEWRVRVYKLCSIAIGAAITLCVIAVPALAEDWVELKDDLYGCSIIYPGNVFRGDVAVPGRPLKFSGPNDETYFQVMGSANAEGLSPRAIKERYFGDAVPGDVTYESAKGGFLVVSGYRGESIFYTRLQISDDGTKLCILEITYPRKDKAAFDEIVTRMSHSFSAD